MIVFPVRIIMSPTSSSRFLVGKNARSATLRTNSLLSDDSPSTGTRPAPSAAKGMAPLQRVTNPNRKRRPGARCRATFAAAMRGRAAALAGTSLLALAGCGGERQDADEPTGTYPVEIVQAKFPRSQRLAEHTTMEITVRNAGSKTIPNVAVTVDGFDSTSDNGQLAD